LVLLLRQSVKGAILVLLIGVWCFQCPASNHDKAVQGTSSLSGGNGSLLADYACKLALEDIHLLEASEEPEHWIKVSTAAINFQASATYIDRSSDGTRSLNSRYFIDKSQLLNEVFSQSHPRMWEDISAYSITEVRPQPNQTLFDYLAEVVEVETFHTLKSEDRETGLLNSLNRILTIFAARDSSLIALFLAELEVKFPVKYIEFTNAAEVHSLYLVKTEISRIESEIQRLTSRVHSTARVQSLNEQREALLSGYKEKRSNLFRRLKKEENLEELVTAEGLFGLDL